MSKHDELYELIKSLNKSEKRFFKIFSKRYSTEINLKYIALFDIYDSYSSFNREKFNHEIKIHKLDGNIRYLKHQLNLQLLRSLNAYNYSQNNIEIQVSNLIQNASILINKGLFDQAHKTIQQAKTIAKEHELILYLLDCFRKEKHISRELYQIDWIEYYTNEGSFEEKKLLIEYEKTYDIYKARNELIFINNSTNDANTIIKIENFILNINHREDSSFEILETEYITKAYLYITKKEYENAKKFQKLLISLFEKHPNQINLNQANYLSALYNLLVSSFILKDFEQVELILQKLDNYRNSSANRLVNLKLFNYINIGLAFYNLNGDFKKSCSYQPLIHKGLVYFNQSIHIYAKMSLFLHLVTAHIGIGDYEKANYWVDRAITEITTKNLLHYFLAKILQLIIIYEEKRYTYLVHLSKELSEDLVTLKNDYQSFKIIVDFFKIHKFHLLNKKQLNLVFNEFKEELETFINTKNEKSIFDVFDIITWINSHIYNQSFDYLIKLKFKDYYEPIIKKHHKNSPNKPGVYQYFNTEGTILYVGKAKNLKKRVSSYFTKNHKSGKTAILVRQIADIKTIVVGSEIEALLLENNLIKKYQPKYNIMLKDDKTYPWICIKNERFPRVFSTRNVLKDGSDYFGPYASVKMMNTVLDLIRQLYPLRNCNYNLSKENIAENKFKVCLEYHIGNCKGPCVDEQTEEDYNEAITNIKAIIKGNINSVTRHLKPLMKEYADHLQFEKAQQIKEKIEILEKYQSKSVMVSPSINDVDVFSIISDEKYGYVNYLKVINGAIIQGHTIELKKKLDETDDELLQIGIAELRQRFDSQSKEVIVPFKPDLEDENIRFLIPQRGDKKKLLELSERNAKYYRLERNKQKANVSPTKHSDRILERLQKDLRMPEKPVHIECFDNSNIQGSNPVAACVVFKDAKPSKRDYRHFNIKTVEGPNDFASMEEVIYRRYKRLLDENQSLPQLIIIDGGKGQLSSALKSIDELGLRGKITIIGIAKKLEEIYFPNDSIPLYLDKKSESLKLIQYLRNEAHRFGITHHRNKRSKGAIKSELAEVEGIGYKTAQQLLWKFKSVARVKKASLEELEATVSKKRAKIVYEHFHS